MTRAIVSETRHEKWDKARLGRILGRITRKIDDEAKEMRQHQETQAEIQAHRERVALKRTGDHSAERGIAAGGDGKEEEEKEVQRKGVGMEKLAVAGGSDEKVSLPSPSPPPSSSPPAPPSPSPR